MVEKAKLFYFGVLVLVIVAFIFHVVAMGHHHWKIVYPRYNNASANVSTIGLFTRCVRSRTETTETCFPNLYPTRNASSVIGGCNYDVCLWRNKTNYGNCGCDFIPSTKGIAACTILASIFLGLSFIIIFIHSVNTSTTRSVRLILGIGPLIFLILAFIFILIALILVGSYLSRDTMHLMGYFDHISDLGTYRTIVGNAYTIRVDYSTGLEIISLFLTFLSVILYGVFVFKLGRST